MAVCGRGCVWLCVASKPLSACVCPPPSRPCPALQGNHARRAAAATLQGLAYCHNRGVVHGSLGSGSVMLSSFDDKTARRLVVKLDNVRGAPAGSQKSASGAVPPEDVPERLVQGRLEGCSCTHWSHAGWIMLLSLLSRCLPLPCTLHAPAVWVCPPDHSGAGGQAGRQGGRPLGGARPGARAPDSGRHAAGAGAGAARW